MDVVFTDKNGNKKNFLYQYDKGQSLVIENFEYDTAPKVQFSLPSLEMSLSTQATLYGTTMRVSVPNALLTQGEDIIAYLYLEEGRNKGQVVDMLLISVKKRKRPSNYVYSSEMFAMNINGTTISDNFGYADILNWQDNNPNSEDRFGYFVSIEYKDGAICAKKATSVQNVYGVSAQAVGFASNCNESKLSNTGFLLPQYTYVCSSGFATVIDNGTCNAGDMCVPTDDGTAILSDSFIGYKVLDRIDENHIFILVTPSIDTINSIKLDITNVENDLLDHKNDTSNPHEVTQEQVGLGNVPNVTTNDQTPTYTEATTLEKTKSGEKLSIAFGKITKAIADLISHINNKDNPHGVTKAQIGLGKVENTSDADKPISTLTQNALNLKADLVNGLVPISQLPSQVKEMRIVNTIADRDKITDKFENLRVYVKDATADSTVKSGGADYLYDGSTWIKTGEAESLDLVLSWDNVSDKPEEYIPAKHASTHAINGTDAIKPSDIGAAPTQHNHTKNEVGLANVDNTSDENKPISTLTQAALDTKPTLVDGKVQKDNLPDDVYNNAVVETLAERDALTPFKSLLVHVKTDETNDNNATDYIYDGSKWSKLSGTSSGVVVSQTSIPLIVGTQTASTNAWTGTTSDVESLSNGLSIRYWLPYISTGNVTLNLTLKDGSTTGAINCYSSGTTQLSYDLEAGNIIWLTYMENANVGSSSITGWWTTVINGATSEYDNGDAVAY